MSVEWFNLLDDSYHVVGKAQRAVCHANPGLMHGSVHVLVFDSQGRLFLQKRSMRKDLQPGCWDTSVGGHLQPGESPESAARRETREELGFEAKSLCPAYQYVWNSDCETELITTFATVHDGPFRLCPEEISEGRFWSADEIASAVADPDFPLTPQFRSEYARITDWRAQAKAQGL